MTYFYLVAATIIVVALAVLLRPWWRSGRRVASADNSHPFHQIDVAPGVGGMLIVLQVVGASLDGFVEIEG